MGCVPVTTQFNPNTFEYGDAAGLGAWLVGHYRQHLVYNQVLAARTPPIILVTYNIFAAEGGHLGTVQWLNDHESWHELLRPLANITGIDLSQVDMTDKNQFYEWIDAHNQEHAALDVVFGVA